MWKETHSEVTGEDDRQYQNGCNVDMSWYQNEFYGNNDRGYGLDWSISGQRQVLGSWENGKEHFGFIKCGKFFD